MDNIVELNKLELGTHVYDFQLDSAYLSGIEKSELLGGNVSVKAKLDLRSTSMLLHIWVDGVVQVVCDRCLDSMDITVSADDDMDIENDAQSIDLNWLAYELIVVNLPIVHFHNTGDCNPEMDTLLRQHLRSTLAEPENAS